MTVAAEGGLEPSPARRLRGTYPHRLHSYAKRVVCRRLVLLVAHSERQLQGKLHDSRSDRGATNHTEAGRAIPTAQIEELRMVEGVEHLRPELHARRFIRPAQPEVLDQRQIGVVLVWTMDNARARVAEGRAAIRADDRPVREATLINVVVEFVLHRAGGIDLR